MKACDYTTVLKTLNTAPTTYSTIEFPGNLYTNLPGMDLYEGRSN